MRNCHQHNAVPKLASLLTSIVVFSMSCEVVVADSTNDVTIEDIKGIARQCRERLSTLDVTYTFSSTVTPARDSLVPSARHHVLLDVVGLRSHFWSSRDHSIDRRKALSTTALKDIPDVKEEKAWDGQILTTYRAQLKSGVIDAIPGATPPFDLRRQDKYFSCTFRYAPSEHGVGLDDGSLESFLEQSPVIEGHEVIDGSDCVKISCFATRNVGTNGADAAGRFKIATLWLSSSQDFMVRRMAAFSSSDEPPTIEIMVREAKLLADVNGIENWLPTRISIRALKPGSSTDQTIELDTASAVVNPLLEARDFSVNFPDGTVVFDKQSETQFVVGQPHVKFEKAPDHKQPPVKSRSYLWLVAANVFLVSIGIVVQRNRIRANQGHNR